ncbi:hypothetical protein OIU78_015261 [Salix suchowensis]|nr:hypothetical protein OIU78_015261 [Salix suchowensis]
MQYAGVVPNRVTMVNALGACGSFRAIEMGVWIHDFIKGSGWDLDVILGTSLVEMYLKCGRIDEGLIVFRSMKEKNVFTWNVVIQGLGFAKSGQEAVWWFNRMEQEGFEADEVTLANVLNACIQSGLVDMGRQIFSSLINGNYGFSPSVKHYACMIDLLTHAGCLDEAFKLIKEMPFEASKSIWGSFLTGCRACGNLELSEFAAKKLAELDEATDKFLQQALLSSPPVIGILNSLQVNKLNACSDSVLVDIDNTADCVCSVQRWGEDGSCRSDVDNGWGCSFVEAARLEHDSEFTCASNGYTVLKSSATFAINKPYLTPPAMGILKSLQVNCLTAMVMSTISIRNCS